MRISFLIQNYFGVGGTNTAVHNLAHALGDEHEVEVVSVFRRQDACPHPVADRYSVRSLVDVRRGRPDARHPDRRRPSELIPPSEEMYSQYSILTDDRLRSFLRTTPSDVVIGTRPGLNLVIAGHGSGRYLKISQEHMTQDLIPDEVKALMGTTYGALDACVCLTVADAQALVAHLGRSNSPEVLAIPNGVPEPELAVADCRAPVIVAAGRLADVKRYDLLLHAFACVAGSRPEWTLRLYGAGPERPRLRRLVERLELSDRALLMGRAVPLGSEWVKGSISVSTSSHESFGMTIVEAMRHGLPVVSTDCPVGPSEIIRDGHDGRLVPVNDPSAVAAALADLMDDVDMRRTMGTAAATSAARFDPAAVRERYSELLTVLDQGRRRSVRDRVVHRGWTTRHRVEQASTRRKTVPPMEDLGEKASEGWTATLAAGGDLVLTAPPSASTDVLVRLRGTQSGEVRIDGDRGPDGVRVTIPATALTAEGRWNVLTVDGERRLRASMTDTRAQISAAKVDDPRRPLPVVTLPYTTADGFLGIRTWTRPQHAECTSITQQDGVLRVGLRIFGAELANGARLDVVRRGPRGDVVSTPLTASDDNTTDVLVDLAELVSRRLTRHDDWDLWVRPHPEQEPIRVARLMDDVVDRKGIYIQPLLMMERSGDLPWVEEQPAPLVRVRPFFASDSGLSVFVAD